MFRFVGFGVRLSVQRLFYLLTMSKNENKVYYAVGRGHEIGVYNTWSECKAQVDGLPNAKYRKFFSLDEAEEFVKFWKDYSSPCKNSKDENSVGNFSKSADNFARSDGGFEKQKALGVENTLERKDPAGLKPYVSPISLSLQRLFRVGVDKVDNHRNFLGCRRCTMPERKNNNISFTIRSAGANNFIQTGNLGVVAEENSNDLSSYTATPIKSVGRVEASPQNTVKSQCADVLNKPVIKKEAISEDEVMTEVCSKLPICLETLQLVLKELTKETHLLEKFRNILKNCLEMFGRTNCSINPQMESDESDMNSKRSEVPEEEQQTFTPSAHTPSSSSHKAMNAEVLAVNLRLDSFEKRFDACLKEVGGIMSEISHIKGEIIKIKQSLGQEDVSPKKGKDGLLQTTLDFESPKTPKNYSRAYSTAKGATNDEAEHQEYTSNRGKRRRLSRSDSSGSSKRIAEDKDDDIFSRIKTEKVEYTSFCLDENDFVEVYTDGACHYNGEHAAKAGIGIWFGDSHPLNVSEPVNGSATNNFAEIQAARIAIELAVKAGVKKLKVLTDSEFLINCVTKWIQRWKRNGWTLVRGGSVKNRKELEKLDRAASKISVRWEKVLAHSGIKGNEMADRLANQGAERYSK